MTGTLIPVSADEYLFSYSKADAVVDQHGEILMIMIFSCNCPLNLMNSFIFQVLWIGMIGRLGSREGGGGSHF